MDWLHARARSSPRRLAVIGDGQAVTWEQLAEQIVPQLAGRVRALLDQHASAQPIVVAVLARPGLTTVALIHAMRWLGVPLLYLNTRLTAEELRYQIDQAGCRIVLADPAFAEVATKLAGAGYAIYGLTDSSDLPALPEAPPHSESCFAPADTMALLYTSGTSGRPRAVQLTYDNFFASALGSAYHLGLAPDDVWLCVLPLFHVGGLSMVVRSCLHGNTLILHPSFDLDAVQDALARGDATHISLVPTMLYRLLQARTTTWHPRLKLILLGGAAASPELLALAASLGVPVATTYGLTEATSQVTTALPDLAQEKPGTVGRPLPFVTVRIVDEAGHEVAPGVIGEVLVQGPTMMTGYLNDKPATQAAVRFGWLHTGDLGYLDADGDLFLIQRRSDLIISGGENVYPSEVEAVLRLHPAVAEAGVTGLPHPEWGQQVAAAIVLRLNEVASATQIEQFARERLAGYKIPRRFVFVPHLPQTASGKVQRSALTALFLD